MKRSRTLIEDLSLKLEFTSLKFYSKYTLTGYYTLHNQPTYFKSNVRKKYYKNFVIEQDVLDFFRTNFVNNQRRYIQFWMVDENRYDYISYDIGNHLNLWGDNIPYIKDPFNKTTTYGPDAGTPIDKYVVYLQKTQGDDQGTLEYTTNGNLIMNDKVFSSLEKGSTAKPLF